METIVRNPQNDTFGHERAYAIENGPSGFDPAAPRHLPKTRFLMLMRNEQLATLATSFDETDHRLNDTRFLPYQAGDCPGGGAACANVANEYSPRAK